jgi:hypothetical protein
MMAAEEIGATASSLGKQYAETAEFYRTYAGRFEPGSLGYLGNMNEAAKYAEMAERFGSVDPRARRVANN